MKAYDVNQYYYPGMDKTQPYYFGIEAINENRMSVLTPAETQ